MLAIKGYFKKMILYILNERDSCSYKIGHTKSKNAKHRVKTLSTGNKKGIDIIWEYEHDEANKIENMLHRYYMWCRDNGEWFNFENVNIEDVKERALKFSDILKDIKNKYEKSSY